MLIISNDKERERQIKSELSKAFTIKDFVEALQLLWVPNYQSIPKKKTRKTGLPTHSQLANAELFNDNQGAGKRTENVAFHSRSKHINIRNHFIRDLLVNL